MFEGKYSRLMLMLLTAWLNASLAEEMRDPTRPPNVSRLTADRPAVLIEATSAYRLSMTKTGGETDIAVINGKNLKVGEKIDDAKVSAIRSGEVDLLMGSEKYLIKIQRSVVKQPVDAARIEINTRREDDEG